MPGENDITRVIQVTDRFLLTKRRKHIRMVEQSIIKLQEQIINSINNLSTTSDGKLETLRINLKQLQQIHKKVDRLFHEDFSSDTKAIIDDFSSISELIERNYSYLNMAVKFTSIDKQVMNVLADGFWRDYLAIGEVKKNNIIKEMYNHVIAGNDFNSLVNTIEQNLMGSNVVSATGRPLVQYSRLYANDMIMNFQNEVNVKKAEDIGMKYFLYVGDIIATTRDFCRKRAGKYYTKNQINSWTYKWAGKSGPAMIHRGGYNCRHHWQPIDPKWLNGKKKINVADWNLEQVKGG